MPPSRLPSAKAKAKGAELKNKARHAPRKERSSSALGHPSAWLAGTQLAVWAAFQKELPWLCERDRSLVEIATVVRARLMDGQDVGVNALALLRLSLAQMGATPADATRVSAGSDDEPAKLEDKYFN